MQLTVKQALEKLKQSQQRFVELFAHGSLSVEIYKPVGKDLQQPHDRDEIYVVISGNGTFSLNGVLMSFQAGDFLFVPAFAEHRFETFSEDFATWVFFYGSKGGENNTV